MRHNVFRVIAKQYGTTPKEVYREIQAAIDEAWDTDDLAVMKQQRELFPNGKPTPEQFLLTLASKHPFK